jgi:hypothetical protein
MAAAKKPFKVPYDVRGGIMAYPENSFSHYVDGDGETVPMAEIATLDWKAKSARSIRLVYREPDWRENETWSGTLRLSDFMRGRSAARFIWLADGDPVDQQRTYPMFMVDMLDLLKTIGVQPGGLVHARWNVAKRGANFGIKVVE